MTIPAYSYEDLRSCYNGPEVADEMFNRALEAIDENFDGYIDFVDASWSFNDFSIQEVLQKMGADVHPGMIPSYFENPYQPLGFRNVITPNLPGKFNDIFAFQPQECSSFGPLSREEAQIALDVFTGLCHFLEADPIINPEFDHFQFCNNYCPVDISDKTVELTSMNNTPKIDIRQIEHEPVDNTTDDDVVSDSPSNEQYVTTGIILYDEHQEEFLSIIDNVYDATISDKELPFEDRQTVLDYLEDIMTDPSGNEIRCFELEQ